VFWWSFEYLNRFVGNWRYLDPPGFGAGEYFLFATLPFATVLPAVLSTRELLLSCRRFDGAFRGGAPLPARDRGRSASPPCSSPARGSSPWESPPTSPSPWSGPPHPRS
jgi:hypothetical protein